MNSATVNQGLVHARIRDLDNALGALIWAELLLAETFFFKQKLQYHFSDINFQPFNSAKANTLSSFNPSIIFPHLHLIFIAMQI